MPSLFVLVATSLLSLGARALSLQQPRAPLTRRPATRAPLVELSLDRPASLDVLLQVRVGDIAPAEIEAWLRRRPFAAILPMQPMLVQPLERPQHGIDVTFRRKPTSEKGGQDGGLRFAVAADDETGDAGSGTLLVTRISEGQYTPKMFSERAIVRALMKDLEKLPADCGSLLSVVELKPTSSFDSPSS